MAIKRWWQAGKEARRARAIDAQLRKQALAGALVYAQEIWDRRMREINQARLINGQEIQLARRLKSALTLWVAQNAAISAMGRAAPIEEVWTWDQLAKVLFEAEGGRGEFKQAGALAKTLLTRDGSWSGPARGLCLDDAGYAFEIFQEDATLCARMVETRMGALPLAREILSSSKIRIRAPSSGRCEVERGVSEALAIIMAERAARLAHSQEDPLSELEGWPDLAHLLGGEAGCIGPLQTARKSAEIGIYVSSYSRRWNDYANYKCLDGAGYSWSAFLSDAEKCQELTERQSESLRSGRSIHGRLLPRIARV